MLLVSGVPYFSTQLTCKNSPFTWRSIDGGNPPHKSPKGNMSPRNSEGDICNSSHRIHGTGIFTYIYHKHQPNVGKYTIHGSYGVSGVGSMLIQQLDHWDDISHKESGVKRWNGWINKKPDGPYEFQKADETHTLPKFNNSSPLKSYRFTQ